MIMVLKNEHLVKVVSARYVQCKVIYFPSVINEDSSVDAFWVRKVFFS